MRVKEEWKQTVRWPDAWKSIAGTLMVVCAIGVSMPILSQLRIERLLSGVLLVVVWIVAVCLLLMAKWRNWPFAQKLFLAGCTLLAGGDLFPHRLVVSWLTNIGGLVFACAIALTVFDFSKRRSSGSVDAVSPEQQNQPPGSLS